MDLDPDRRQAVVDVEVLPVEGIVIEAEEIALVLPVQMAGAIEAVQLEPAVIPEDVGLVHAHALEGVDPELIALLVPHRAGAPAVLVEDLVDRILRHVSQDVEGHPA